MKITVAEVYQFLLIIFLIAGEIFYFVVNKTFEETMLGALIGLAVGIGGKNIGIDKDIE